MATPALQPKTSSPSKAPAKTFRITATKIAVLKALAEYFALPVKTLSILIYNRSDEITRTSVNRTLLLLEAEGLVGWRKLSSRIKKVGADPIIYGLSKKGVDLAADEGLV